MKPILDIPLVDKEIIAPVPTPHVQNHPTGNAFFENNIPLVSPQYDTGNKTGRALELGATNDLAIPIHNNGGAELIPDWLNYNWLKTNATLTVNADSITMTATTANALYQLYTEPIVTEVGKTYMVYVNIISSTEISKTNLRVYDLTNGVNIYEEVAVLGEQAIVFTATSISTRIYIPVVYSTVTNIGDTVEVKDISVKEITSMANSFLTYHDIENDEIIQIGNAVDGGSSKELILNGDFSADPEGSTSITGFNYIARGTQYQTATSMKLTTTEIVQDKYGVVTSSSNAATLPSDGGSYLIEFDITELSLNDPLLEMTVAPSTGQNSGVNNSSNFVPSLGHHAIPYTLEINETLLTIALGNADGAGLPQIGDYVAIDNITYAKILPTSTEYILNDVTVNNILTHQMPFSEGDLTLIQQEPNLLAALAMGELTPISSVTLDADDSWYSCSEVSGEFVVDQRAGYGADESAHYVQPHTVTGVTVTPVTDGTRVEFIYSTETSNYIRFDVNVALPSRLVVLEFSYKHLADNYPTFNGYHNGVEPVYFSTTYNVVDGLNGIIVETFNNNVAGCYMLRSSGTPSYSGEFTNISVREATASEIADYTEANRITNQQKGLQTTALLLDGAGVPESYNSTPNTARVYDDTIISTGFKPSIARYSIEESVSGELQDFGGEGLVNGDFTDNIDSWQAANAATVTHQDGAMLVNVTGSGGGFSQSNLSTIAGETYIVTAEFNFTTYTNGGIQVRLGGSDVIPIDPTPSGEYYLSVELEPVTTEDLASLTTTRTGSATGEYTVDNISIKQDLGKTQRTEKRLLTHTDITSVDTKQLATDIPSGTASNGDNTYTSTLSTGRLGGITTHTSGNIRIEFAINAITAGSVEGINTTNIAFKTTTYDGGLDLTGFSGEVEILRVNAVEPETKYYIDDVEQAVVPPLPDPNTTINLGNVAVIGYPDTIESREADFNVHSEIITPTSAVTHNGELITDNGLLVTHTEGI